MVGRALLAMSVVGLVACSGDDVTGPESVAGTYLLQSIDGMTLPTILTSYYTTYTSEYVAGSITLDQDMTCRDAFTIRKAEGGSVTTETDVDVCTYTYDSDDAYGAITVSWSGGRSAAGSITGSQLRLVWPVWTSAFSVLEGLVLIFEK